MESRYRMALGAEKHSFTEKAQTIHQISSPDGTHAF